MVKAVAVGDGRLKPLEAELSRSLQKYLLHMGLLPKLGSQVGFACVYHCLPVWTCFGLLALNYPSSY